ncbi:hypothetical protein [Clostridium manihotivorum]|uniref:Uncharacterized protein n=1 Tax=Clostridium manihotivorum TaxID=2320868 RepID=A0A3R5U461_9CLOT|nr:hypothetical protein [Clostridium manihotivorum]QAA31181.1 hypothetical protein C1I91_05600 [Clostridium manihotivorum]
MEYISEEGYILFSKYPEEIEENKFLLIENPDNFKRKLLGEFDTEIEAYQIYKKVSHHRKKVAKGKVIYKTVLGTRLLWDYEEYDEIK